MADYLPPYRPGEKPTRLINGTVTGGRMVSMAGIHCAANATDFDGIASRNAVAGERIVVEDGRNQFGIAAGAIAAGAPIKCADDGQLQTWAAGDSAAALVGRAATAAANAGDQFEFVRA